MRRFITDRELPMNRQLFNFARGFIGILAALPLLSTELFQLGRFVLPGIAVTIVTLMIGVQVCGVTACGSYLINVVNQDSDILPGW
ncbi:hypothetical protein O7746_07760 [Corynebacterium pseudotuberculosis]|nr:hypothetical protein [Corynebacterium pseudotuberculosis]WFP67290.1 hypothetical protein P8128_00470 [Corynebacterium pseudotuberculosis]